MRCDKSETYQKWNMFFEFMILLAKTKIIANPEKKIGNCLQNQLHARLFKKIEVFFCLICDDWLSLTIHLCAQLGFHRAPITTHTRVIKHMATF